MYFLIIKRVYLYIVKLKAIVVDGDPHKVQKITQGKRGKGGGFVRY